MQNFTTTEVTGEVRGHVFGRCLSANDSRASPQDRHCATHGAVSEAHLVPAISEPTKALETTPVYSILRLAIDFLDLRSRRGGCRTPRSLRGAGCPQPEMLGNNYLIFFHPRLKFCLKLI